MKLTEREIQSAEFFEPARKSRSSSNKTRATGEYGSQFSEKRQTKKKSFTRETLRRSFE